MKHNRRTRTTRRLAALGAALILVLSMGSAALAEPATTAEAAETVAAETQSTQSTLTDEQKLKAQQDARATYDAAVDAVLNEMVAVGALTQESVDSYHALRDAERLVAQIDTSNWTLDQVSAYKQALRGGSANDTVLAGLMSQGALTQENVDAIKQACSSDRVTLSGLMSKIDTAKATQAMVTQLQDARKAYIQALSDAGIVSGRGRLGAGSTKGAPGNAARDASGNSGTRGGRKGGSAGSSSSGKQP